MRPMGYRLVQLDYNEGMFVRADLREPAEGGEALPLPDSRLAWLLGFYARPARRQCFWWLESARTLQTLVQATLRDGAASTEETRRALWALAVTSE